MKSCCTSCQRTERTEPVAGSRLPGVSDGPVMLLVIPDDWDTMTSADRDTYVAQVVAALHTPVSDPPPQPVVVDSSDDGERVFTVEEALTALQLDSQLAALTIT
jgi:hypothetical protein